MKQLLEQYLKNLTDASKRGDAREESYYKHLDILVKQYADNQKIKDIDVTILPKKTEAGFVFISIFIRTSKICKHRCKDIFTWDSIWAIVFADCDYESSRRAFKSKFDLKTTKDSKKIICPLCMDEVLYQSHKYA